MVILAAGLLCLPRESAAVTPPPGAPEVLNLEKALRRAYSSNRALHVQKLTLRGSEIGYDNAWDTMFMPALTLNANSTTAYTVTHLPGDRARAVGDSANTHGYPSTSAQLNLGSYTIFNFWKDWAVYEQARLDWTRSQEGYVEAVRALKFQVIGALFRLKTEQEKVDTTRRSVDMSEAIVGLVKSRVRLGKASQSDVSSSTVDYLTAKNEYNQRESDAKGALWAMNQLLGDPIDTQYRVEDTIKYVRLSINAESAIKTYAEQSPSAKTAKKDLRKAELSVELEEKNRLPLPKLSFSGVTLSYNSTYYGTTPDLYTQQPGNVNLDLSASVTLSLPIYGPGGIFNSRRVEQARISRDVTEISYIDSKNRDQVAIYQLINAIKRDEDGIANNEKNFQSSASLLDSLFSRLSGGSVSRLELRDAIRQARDSEIALFEAKLAQLTDKLALAQLIGVDHLPGDNY